MDSFSASLLLIALVKSFINEYKIYKIEKILNGLIPKEEYKKRKEE